MVLSVRICFYNCFFWPLKREKIEVPKWTYQELENSSWVEKKEEIQQHYFTWPCTEMLTVIISHEILSLKMHPYSPILGNFGTHSSVFGVIEKKKKKEYYFLYRNATLRSLIEITKWDICSSLSYWNYWIRIRLLFLHHFTINENSHGE